MIGNQRIWLIVVYPKFGRPAGQGSTQSVDGLQQFEWTLPYSVPLHMLFRIDLKIPYFYLCTSSVASAAYVV